MVKLTIILVIMVIESKNNIQKYVIISLEDWLRNYNSFDNTFDATGYKLEAIPKEFNSNDTKVAIPVNKPQKLITLDQTYILDRQGQTHTHSEDITALAYKLKKQNDWKKLTPRTLSFLPVARACQASCKFCFSEASLSKDQKKRIKDFDDLEYWCKRAADSGAERFVITGGGEPTIIGHDEIRKALNISSQYFSKNVLVTNGMHISDLEPPEIKEKLKELHNAGLSIFAISYHHYEQEENTNIMGVDTKAERVMEAAAGISDIPTLRLMCVIQKGGVDSEERVTNYLDFASSNKIKQVCFKELYVASSLESEYANTPANLYSRANQIKLEPVSNYCRDNGFKQVGQLPWGCPIYYDASRDIQIIAFSDPSVGWEKNNKLSRSWNYTADKKCYASLEDTTSQVTK